MQVTSKDLVHVPNILNYCMCKFLLLAPAVTRVQVASSVFAESLYEKLEIIQVEGFIIARERYSGE